MDLHIRFRNKVGRITLSEPKHLSAVFFGFRRYGSVVNTPAVGRRDAVVRITHNRRGINGFKSLRTEFEISVKTVLLHERRNDILVVSAVFSYYLAVGNIHSDYVGTAVFVKLFLSIVHVLPRDKNIRRKRTCVTAVKLAVHF